MNKRTQDFKLVVILGILFVLAIMAVQTVWTGLNLCLYSIEVEESGRNADCYPEIRAYADEVYGQVEEGRSKFYNSNNAYIRWISNASNLVRVPVAIIVISSPVLFIYLVRSYNLNKSRRRARK